VERVQPIAKAAAGMVDADLLRYYLTEFDRYKTSLERVDRLFAFYNCRWAKKDGEGSVDVKILPVNSLALAEWKENCTMVLQRDEKKLTNAVLQLIVKERSGEGIDENLVKKAIDSFIALDDNYCSPDEQCSGLYQEFESSFLRATADYHKKELEQIFQTENIIPDYLNKVEEILLDEESRSKRYLPQNSHDKVIRTVFIHDHCAVLVERLRETGEDEKLKKMNTLLSRITPSGFQVVTTLGVNGGKKKKKRLG